LSITSSKFHQIATQADRERDRKTL